MAKSQRLVAYFSGAVQGIGFRFTTLDIARRFPDLTGFVRNLDDGRVEIVAEASPETLDAFLNAVELAMGRSVADVETARRPAMGEYRSFIIRH